MFKIPSQFYEIFQFFLDFAWDFFGILLCPWFFFVSLGFFVYSGFLWDLLGSSGVPWFHGFFDVLGSLGFLASLGFLGCMDFLVSLVLWVSWIPWDFFGFLGVFWCFLVFLGVLQFSCSMGRNCRAVDGGIIVYF